MKQTWTLTSEARLSRLILGCIAVDRSTPLKPSYDTRNSPWFSPSSTTPSFIQTLDDNVNLYEPADERENFLLSRKILLPPRRAGGVMFPLNGAKRLLPEFTPTRSARSRAEDWRLRGAICVRYRWWSLRAAQILLTTESVIRGEVNANDFRDEIAGCVLFFSPPLRVTRINQFGVMPENYRAFSPLKSARTLDASLFASSCSICRACSRSYNTRVFEIILVRLIYV